jgi:hypothetical protein
VGGNTYGEVETGEYGSVFTGFSPEISNELFQVTYADRFRGSIAPVPAEGGLGTPTIGGVAAPVGVVHEGGFIHEWIVLLTAAR